MKKSFVAILSMALISLSSNLILAQETQEQAIIVSSIETSDSDGPAGQQLRVFSTDSAMPQTLFMDSFGGNSSFSFGFGGTADKFSMLQNPAIQKEIELVDEQVQQIRKIQKEFGKKIKDQLKGGISGDKARNLGEMIKKLKEEQQEQIKEILLEHQRERLNQVSLQQTLRNSGTANALASKSFREELGLSDEQVKGLREKAAELKKEMEEKIKKMREEMKEELLGELSSSQRRKLKKMLGDKYEPDTDAVKKSFREQMRRIRDRRKNDGD